MGSNDYQVTVLIAWPVGTRSLQSEPGIAPTIRQMLSATRLCIATHTMPEGGATQSLACCLYFAAEAGMVL
jgi:hypothetical protein